MSGLFLGIDTSNYTTSLSLFDGDRIIANEKLPVKVKEGERGIRQSDAVFCHTKNLPILFERIGRRELSAIGVSTRPRDVEGSYMPCFLTGYAAAKALSSVCGIPLYELSHQQGHVMAALYSAGRTDLWNERFIAFHVSGGTTELLLVENGTIGKIGGTIDLNAGQAIDRIGVRLGIPFPCGRELEKIAAPLADVNCISHVRGLECNLSGLESKATKLIDDGEDRSIVAAFTIKSVLRTIERLTENARETFGDLPVVYAGGVMSNKLIQNGLAKCGNVYFSEAEYSCDNAAGIAVLAARAHDHNDHNA